MDIKASNMIRGRKKLRYFAEEERLNVPKINDVFSLRDVDDYFDFTSNSSQKLDSGFLSPPAKTTVEEEEEGALQEDDEDEAPCAPCPTDISNTAADVDLMEEEIPFPLKTSSPIVAPNLPTANGQDQDEPRTSTVTGQDKPLASAATVQALDRDKCLASAVVGQRKSLVSAARGRDQPPVPAAGVQEEPPVSTARGQDKPVDSAATALPAPGQDKPLASAAKDQDKPLASAAKGQDKPLASAAKGQDKPLASAAKGQDKPLASAAKGQDKPLASAAKGQGKPLASAAKDQDQPVVSAATLQDQPLTSALGQEDNQLTSSLERDDQQTSSLGQHGQLMSAILLSEDEEDCVEPDPPANRKKQESVPANHKETARQQEEKEPTPANQKPMAVRGEGPAAKQPSYGGGYPRNVLPTEIHTRDAQPKDQAKAKEAQPSTSRDIKSRDQVKSRDLQPNTSDEAQPSTSSEADFHKRLWEFMIRKDKTSRPPPPPRPPSPDDNDDDDDFLILDDAPIIFSLTRKTNTTHSQTSRTQIQSKTNTQGQSDDETQGQSKSQTSRAKQPSKKADSGDHSGPDSGSGSAAPELATAPASKSKSQKKTSQATKAKQPSKKASAADNRGPERSGYKAAPEPAPAPASKPRSKAPATEKPKDCARTETRAEEPEGGGEEAGEESEEPHGDDWVRLAEVRSERQPSKTPAGRSRMGTSNNSRKGGKWRGRQEEEQSDAAVPSPPAVSSRVASVTQPRRGQQRRRAVIEEEEEEEEESGAESEITASKAAARKRRPAPPVSPPVSPAQEEEEEAASGGGGEGEGYYVDAAPQSITENSEAVDSDTANQKARKAQLRQKQLKTKPFLAGKKRRRRQHPSTPASRLHPSKPAATLPPKPTAATQETKQAKPTAATQHGHTDTAADDTPSLQTDAETEMDGKTKRVEEKRTKEGKGRKVEEKRRKRKGVNVVASEEETEEQDLPPAACHPREHASGPTGVGQQDSPVSPVLGKRRRRRPCMWWEKESDVDNPPPCSPPKMHRREQQQEGKKEKKKGRRRREEEEKGIKRKGGRASRRDAPSPVGEAIEAQERDSADTETDSPQPHSNAGGAEGRTVGHAKQSRTAETAKERRKRRKRQQQEEEKEASAPALDEADQPEAQLQVNMSAECSPEPKQVHRSVAPQRRPQLGNPGNRRQKKPQPQAEYDIIIEPSPRSFTLTPHPSRPPQSRPRVATPGLPSANLLVPLQSRLARTSADARGGTAPQKTLNGSRNPLAHLSRPNPLATTPFLTRSPKGLKASLDAFADIYHSAKPRSKRTGAAANQKMAGGRRRAANGLRESGTLQSFVADGRDGESQWGSSVVAALTPSCGQDGVNPTASTPVSMSTPGYASVMSATPPKDADMDMELEEQDSPLHNTNSAGFRSGPSSMVELRSFDDDEEEDQTLPSSLHSPCVTQLTVGVCGPELQLLTLDPVDSKNFTAWIRQHWATSRIELDAQLCAGHFRWYTSERRALGHRIDQLSSSHISGKLVLGSYMRKPVPHEPHPTTIFTVCTGSVRIRMSSVRPVIYDPGHVFIVPQSEAYTMDNVTPVPCALVYHQMLPGGKTRLKYMN